MFNFFKRKDKFDAEMLETKHQISAFKKVKDALELQKAFIPDITPEDALNSLGRVIDDFINFHEPWVKKWEHIKSGR